MRRTAFATAALVASVAWAADDENTEDVIEARHGAWKAVSTVDTFEETPIMWSAVHPHGDYGSFKFVCESGTLKFLGEADNPFVKSLGNMFDTETPITAKFKVDDNPVVTSGGYYPNEVATYNVDELVAAMSEGKRAKVRTTHGDEQHTFTLDLGGFKEAAAWVKGKCAAE